MSTKVKQLATTIGLILTIFLGIYHVQSTHAATQFNDQFITNAQLLDGTGQPSNHFDEFDTMQAHYDFQIPDDQVINAGDTMQVVLPHQLFINHDTAFDILDHNGAIIAKAIVNQATGQVMLTFTDYYATHTANRQGSFNISTNWRSDDITINTEIPLDWGNQGITNVYVGPNDQPDQNEQLWKWGSIDSNDPTLIHWTVRVNYKQLIIQNAIFTDILGPNQTLVPDSIRASHVVYGEGNQYTVVSTVPSQQIQMINQQSFQINLGDLDDTVLINYDARATDDGYAANYTNQARLTGDHYVSTSVNVHTAVTGGNGNGIGSNQDVILTKQDAADRTKTLSGAHFKLVNESGATVAADLVTDQNGQLKVKQLAIGNYQFIETKAPTGYQLDATPVSFTIGANQEQAVKVYKTNQALQLGQVTLIKQDYKTHNQLAGAVFVLKKANGQVIKANLITDQTGQLVVGQLPIGDYYFVETKAPNGYQLDQTPVKFSISSETRLVTVFKDNQPIIPTRPVPDQPVKKQPAPTNRKEQATKLPQTGIKTEKDAIIIGNGLIGLVGLIQFNKIKKKSSILK